MWDLGGGSSGLGGGGDASTLSQCAWLACAPTVGGQDGDPHQLVWRDFTPIEGSCGHMVGGNVYNCTIIGYAAGWVPGASSASNPLLLPSFAQPGQDVGTLVKGFAELVHPFEVAAANGFMFVTGATLVVAGHAAIIAGCVDPTPFEPVTCLGGAAAGGLSITSGVGTLTLAGYVFKTITVPAFREWGGGD